MNFRLHPLANCINFSPPASNYGRTKICNQNNILTFANLQGITEKRSLIFLKENALTQEGMNDIKGVGDKWHLLSKQKS